MDEDFQAWIGRTETTTDTLSCAQAQSAQAMLDDTGPALADGDALPPLWHWFYFLPRARQAALDADGHPQRGGFLPPIPYPRRMFAGARVQWHRPLVIGTPAQREARIGNVMLKSGKSGRLAFVTVTCRFLQHGELCIEESQDIVTNASRPLLPDFSTTSPMRASRFAGVPTTSGRCHCTRAPANMRRGYGIGGRKPPRCGWPSASSAACGARGKK